MTATGELLQDSRVSDSDQFGEGFEVTVGTDPNDPLDLARDPVVLGIGTVALRGGDPTDPENDGNPEADLNYNAIFAAREEAAFAVGEAAFNVFDNVVGGGNDKWCGGDGPTNFPANPLWVSAALAEPHWLTTFTIAAASDTPERDPRVWEIEGSEDGVNFTTSFRKDNPTTSIFTARLQVIQFIAGVHFPEPPPYTTIRFICFATGLTTGARYQLAELEFFGEPGPGVPPRITDVTLDDDSFDITWNSKPGRFHRVE